MKKLLLILLASISFSTYAGSWSLGYVDIEEVGGVTLEYGFSEEDADWDVSVGILFGTSDYGECSGGVCSVIQLDESFVGRVAYNVNENFFVRLSVVDFNYTAAAAGYGVVLIEVGAETETGLGLGFNAGQVSFAYDRFDDANTFSINYNF